MQFLVKLYLLVSGVIHVELRRKVSSKFPLVFPAGLVTPLVTPSDLLQARWHNLACVKCLEMSKPMVVGFCSIGG